MCSLMMFLKLHDLYSDSAQLWFLKDLAEAWINKARWFTILLLLRIVFGLTKSSKIFKIIHAMMLYRIETLFSPTFSSFRCRVTWIWNTNCITYHAVLNVALTLGFWFCFFHVTRTAIVFAVGRWLAKACHLIC